MSSTNVTNTTLPNDPYLAYLPPLARSLPVQSVMLGAILSFLTCLLIHLLLTSPYHRPLSPVNWSLQVASVLLSMLGVCTRIGLILQHTLQTASTWPYMIDYVEVPFPMTTFTVGENVGWIILESAVVALVHITNIQFLILLYPSVIEARSICCLLVPLAVIAAGMHFASLSADQGTNDLGDAIRNICNSTLMLLFAAALSIWGWLNRRRAWRTDGGTAAFGAGAISLAIVGAGVNLALIKIDNVEWLSPFGWTVTLWQLFLAWWWWVGSGMGIGEVEDWLKIQYPDAVLTSSRSIHNRPSRIGALRARLNFSERRRRRRLSKDPPSKEGSISQTPNEGASAAVQPHIPAFLNLPLLNYLGPVWQRLRTAHLSARVIQFEQRGFFGLPGGFFGLGRSRTKRSTDSVQSDDMSKTDRDSIETAVEVDSEDVEGSAVPELAATSSAMPADAPRERARQARGLDRPLKWRRHDRTTYT